jgi:P4 family phage/plasmid primase-like protien
MSTHTQAPTVALLQVTYYPDGGRYSMPPAWTPAEPPPPSDRYLITTAREALSADYRSTAREVWIYPLHAHGGPFVRPSRQATPEIIERELKTQLKGSLILADIDDEPAHAAKRPSSAAWHQALDKALEKYRSFAGFTIYHTQRGARVGLILEHAQDLDTYQEARNEFYSMIEEELNAAGEELQGAAIDHKCKNLGRGFAAPHINKRGQPISPEHARLWMHPDNTPQTHVDALCDNWKARLTRTANANSGRGATPRQATRGGERSASPHSAQPRRRKPSPTYIPAPEHRESLDGTQLYELARSAFAQVCRLTGDEALRLEILEALDRHLMDGRRMQKEGPAWFERTLEEYAGTYPAEDEARADMAPPPPAPVQGLPELSPMRRTFTHGDDLELAHAILESFGDSPAPLWHGNGLRRYDPARGTWTHYGPLTLARVAFTARGAQVIKGESARDYSVSQAKVSAALKMLSAICGADSTESPFDTAPRGIALAGGVFIYAHRDELRVTEASPAHYAIHSLNINLPTDTRRYFETQGAEGTKPSPPPTFTGDYLARSLYRPPEDEDGESPADIQEEIRQKIDTIGEWLGLALLGLCTREAVALVVHGSGSNGKSVLTSLIAELFGPEQCAHLPPQAMSERFSRAQLFGAAVNVVSEMPESDLLSSDTLKAIISGDTIEVERKHQDPFHFTPRAAHIFAANKLPASRDRSHGLWRRLLPISFHTIFSRENRDPYLIERLRAEIPELVLWALDKARGYLARGGFEHTALIERARWAWREITDSVATHTREQLELTDDPKDGDSIKDLWTAFRAWGEDVGLQGAAKMSLTAYAQHLAALPDVKKKRVRVGHKVERRVNLKLKTPPATNPHTWS